MKRKWRREGVKATLKTKCLLRWLQRDLLVNFLKHLPSFEAMPLKIAPFGEVQPISDVPTATIAPVEIDGSQSSISAVGSHGGQSNSRFKKIRLRPAIWLIALSYACHRSVQVKPYSLKLQWYLFLNRLQRFRYFLRYLHCSTQIQPRICARAHATKWPLKASQKSSTYCWWCLYIKWTHQ